MGELDLDSLREYLDDEFTKEQIQSIIYSVLACHEGDELEGIL